MHAVLIGNASAFGLEKKCIIGLLREFPPTLVQSINQYSKTAGLTVSLIRQISDLQFAVFCSEISKCTHMFD